MLFPDKAKTRAVDLRARLIWPFFGLLWLAVAPPAAGAAPTPVPASAPQVVPVPRFHFDAGAPLAAAAGVGPDGAVCVGTVDGYVHGLAPDGSFAWSRTVHGAVTRRPHFAGQRWFIVTSSQRVYALNPDGSLSWVFKLFSPVETELASDASGAVYFVAADQFLYGLTAHGAISLRTRFRPGIKPELTFTQPDLTRDTQGNSWRGRSDGVLEFQPASGAMTASLVPLTSSALFVPAWSSASRLAVVSARSGLVFGLDPARVRAHH